MTPKYTFLFILIILILGSILFDFVSNDRPSSTKVISDFLENEKKFKNAKNDFLKLNVDSLTITNSGYDVLYEGKEYNDSKFNCEENGCIQIIDFMNELHIKSISKNDENVIFYYYVILDYAQSISYIENMQHFEFSGHTIEYSKRLGDNWYYIEEN